MMACTVDDRIVDKFNNDYDLFCKSLHANRGFTCAKEFLAPRLCDATQNTSFDRDYIYHSAWAARRIAEISPEYHTDFSSNIYLAAILSAFIPVRFYDYRPPELELPEVKVDYIDLVKLSFPDNSIPCISCLSVIEHVGLGRYGDPVDPDADLKSIREIQRVVTKGGSILLNIPLGVVPLVCFNAHRIYSRDQIIDMFAGFTLANYLFIHRDKRFPAYTSNPTQAEVSVYKNGNYASGCFHFIKR